MNAFYRTILDEIRGYFMSEKIKIFALGGLDEEGKCLNCVQINNDIFVVDCGALPPDKTMPGVDYLIPNHDFLTEHKDQVKAYILLHGHDDAIGAMPFVYESAPAPVYGSSLTLKMLGIFTQHVKKDPKMYEFHPVPPTGQIKICGRDFHFFHTAHNVADSSGLAIETEYGNIVFTGDFVIENSADPSYLNDMNAIAKIAEKPTLALLPESLYASRPGYTAPLYKLTPHIEDYFKTAEGRIFISLKAQDQFNIDEIIRLAIHYHKKIVCYDSTALDTMTEMASCGQLLIPKENYASLDDILRVRDQDLVVLMLGYGSKLFRKIALLASQQNEDRRIKLKETDTFIVANPSDDNTEIEYVDAADELYRCGCHVFIVPKKTFLRMHASEEDLKMMASILKPKFYIPIKGLFKDLLANAMLALSMGINLNHSNVFVLENGLSVLIDDKGGRLFDEHIPHGDVIIDGAGVGDVSQEVLDDRQKLADGVVIVAATISRKQAEVVAGPDIQMRGFVYGKDQDMVIRDVTKVFQQTMDEFLVNPNYNFEEIQQNVYERCLRTVRRTTGKEPMVLPLMIEVD